MTGARMLGRVGGLVLLAGVMVAVPACSADGPFKIFGDGNFCLFGYSTVPNSDPSLGPVYVPIFKNSTFLLGLENQLTAAVVREIESKTPWKVASCREAAQSELVGTIVARSKGVTVYNQLGEIRDAEM